MAAFANGSEDAFREIVDRYGSRILNLMTRWIGDRDQAEDLVQETFLRVIRHRRDYRRSGRFFSWLYTIAVNLARNEIRNAKRRGTSVVIDTVTGTNETGTLQMEDDRPGADETLGRDELKRLIHAAILELPNRFREVLILRDLQDLKYEEIAEVLGIPGGTVRSRINRARLALKDRLRHFLPSQQKDPVFS